MRPEISALIRPTYPALEDHEAVLLHPRLRGVSDTVVFIDHRVAEDQASNKTLDAGMSRINKYEAEMVLLTNVNMHTIYAHSFMRVSVVYVA